MPKEHNLKARIAAIPLSAAGHPLLQDALATLAGSVASRDNYLNHKTDLPAGVAADWARIVGVSIDDLLNPAIGLHGCGLTDEKVILRLEELVEPPQFDRLDFLPSGTSDRRRVAWQVRIDALRPRIEEKRRERATTRVAGKAEGRAA